MPGSRAVTIWIHRFTRLAKIGRLSTFALSEMKQIGQRMKLIGQHIRSYRTISNYTLEQFGLLSLQLLDSIFDRSDRNHLVNEYRIILSNTVNTINCLILHSWIPPRIEEKDIVRACFVDGCSTIRAGRRS